MHPILYSNNGFIQLHPLHIGWRVGVEYRHFLQGPHLDVNTPFLLNEQLYKHKKAIQIFTPLPPSGNVITLCIGYCSYF